MLRISVLSQVKAIAVRKRNLSGVKNFGEAGGAAKTLVSLVRPRRPVRKVLMDAGERQIEIDASRTAVLVVDMQNDFISEGGWFDVRGIDGRWALDLIEPINAGTALARGEGIPVVWLNWGVRADLLNVHPSHRRTIKPDPADPSYAPRMASGKGPVLERGSWGAEIVPGLVVGPDDIHVAKHRYSGFWDNELDSVLRNLDVTTILLCGINLDRCVFATAIDACNAGYDVVLLQDLTGTHSEQYCADASLFLVDRCFGFVSDLPSLAAGLRPPPSTAP